VRARALPLALLLVGGLSFSVGAAAQEAVPDEAAPDEDGLRGATSDDTASDDAAPDDAAPNGAAPDEAAPDDDRQPVWDAPPSEEPGAVAGEVAAPDDAVPQDLPEDDPAAAPPTSDALSPIRYVLERVEVRGNDKTADFVVLRYVPFEAGDVLDVDDPDIDGIRYRLLGSGYFETVHLSLTRGSARGRVVLVVEVEERNTIIVEHLALGLSQGVENTTDTASDLLPYLGLTLAETNFLGTGIALSLSGLISERQQGVSVRFNDPTFRGSAFSLGLAGFFNNGREFFGTDALVAVRCPPDLDPGEPCPAEVEANSAVVFYRRYGLRVGSGVDLGNAAWLTLDWQPELVDVPIRPDAASEMRGTDIEPIDFAIREGTSFLSTLRLGFHYDNRDDPVLPSRGVLVRLMVDGSSPILGSAYNFLKVHGQVRHWVPMPWGHGHSVRFGIYGGVLFGDAPFFFKFYAADLSDLIPSRILEMNVDDRSPPNLLNTSIVERRSGDLAGRVDVEYNLPIYQGHGGLRSVSGYFGGGLYALSDRRDLALSVPGYEGASKVPVDLTFDFGVRFDTSVGMFQVGFSTLLGFLEL